MEVSSSWGYLVTERKTLTEHQEIIKEARKVYHEGIKKAWDIYTKDNKIVQEAKKALSSAIDEAYKSCLPEDGEGMTQREHEQANRLYVETLSKLHCKFADTIERIWKAFIKDMVTSTWLTEKNI